MADKIKKLATVALAQLILEPAEKILWLVEDMICQPGLYILAGAPKIGKSWLCLMLALAVAEGRMFLGFATFKTGVLYLSLEDTIQRLKLRTWKLLDEFTGKLDIAVGAEKISDGLIEQLDNYMSENAECGLIIIDTFQKVRPAGSDCKYANDYNDLSQLKSFADEHNIAIIVVHHTRKMKDADVFNTISGTHGISGCADGMLVLTQLNRGDGSSILSFTGRDCGYTELKLLFHNCEWELVERTSQEELEEREVPKEVLATIVFIKNFGGVFEGSTTELFDAVGITGITPAAYGKRLAQHTSFMETRGVSLTKGRNSQSSIVRLEYTNTEQKKEAYDG